MANTSIKKNTVLNSIKTASSILFPLITFPYTLRVLQTENVGKVNFGLSIVSYFSLIASLGITTYAIRECSAVREDKNKLSNVSSQIYTINIITTIVAYLAMFVTLLVYRKLDDYRLLIAIQSFTIIATTIGADWLNSAMEDFKFITIRTVAFQVISLALMFIFVHKPEDYMIYAVVSLVASAGANIANVWYRRRYCSVRIVGNLVKGIEWKRHMKPILLLFVMLLAQTIFSSVDSTMLGVMHGDYAVGVYSAAHKILNVINQVVASLLWVIMPRMSYFFSIKDYANVNVLLRKVLGFNLVLGLPIVVGGIMIAQDIIVVSGGEEYAEAATVLQIMLIGFAFSLIGGSFLGNAILLPSKQDTYYMIVCCITAVVNIIGNYIFIPKYGVNAAAMTTAVCSLVIMILLFFKVDKNIKIDHLAKLIISPVVGCVGIAGVCLITRLIPNLWIRVGVCLFFSIAVYGTVQLIFKNEIVEMALSSLKNRLKRA